MKRKNVVLLYDLLLEMLDANMAQSRHVSTSVCTDPVTPATSPNTPLPPQLHSPVAHHVTQVNESQCSQE